MTQEQAELVVRWFEDPAFRDVVLPIMKQRESTLTETIIRDDNPEADKVVKGRIRELRWLITLHDEALSVMRGEGIFANSLI
mgnify:CR=1 FL=1